MEEEAEVKKKDPGTREVKIQTSAGTVVYRDPPAALGFEFVERSLDMQGRAAEAAKGKIDKPMELVRDMKELQTWTRELLKKQILRTPKGLSEDIEEWPLSLYKEVLIAFSKNLRLEADDDLEKKSESSS